MSDNKLPQTTHKPNLFQRVALYLAAIGESSERIDRAIVELREAQKRERVRLKIAQARLAHYLRTGKQVQQ